MIRYLLLITMCLTAYACQPKPGSGQSATTTTAATLVTASTASQARDCTDILAMNGAVDGEYPVFVAGCTSSNCVKTVYCEFEGTSNAWMVIQRRISGSVDFFRPWNDYKDGFGFAAGDFYVGNNYLAGLANTANTYQLLLVLTDFDNNITRYLYDGFRVEPETQDYSLQLGNLISGNKIDHLKDITGQPFGTFDRDTDNLIITCGALQMAGWWFAADCSSLGILNGPYDPVPRSQIGGIMWGTSQKTTRLETVVMYLRRL